MLFFNRFFALGILVFFVLSACGGSGGDDDDNASDDKGIDLQLLAINDYHGHIESDTPGWVDGQLAGGSEYLSAKLNELRQTRTYSLTVAAGDLVGGSPAFSGLFHDEPAVESLNAMQLDVASVGHHEFDEGVDELLRLQNGGCHPVDGCYFSEPYAGAGFQWLAANVVHATTGETLLPPYWIRQFNDIKIGFIGLTLEATDTLVAASGIQGWNFLDEADTANALVPILQAQGVEAIVVLLHEGGSQNPPPGDVNGCIGISGPVGAITDALDPEIDVIITGHTHQPYNCVLEDSAGEPRIVTSAYSNGRVVTEVNLVIDGVTHDVDRALSSATNHVVEQATLTPDPVLTSLIARWQPLVDAAANMPVGTITTDINRGGTPPGSDRGVESAAGNLVADAQLWATSFNFADLAFMNPGGVRSDLQFSQSPQLEGDGVVTYAEAFTFQPFGNTLVTLPMTGAQIVSALEEQCQPATVSRPFLHLGVSDGFTYDLEKTIETGVCTSIAVSNAKLNDVALDLNATYYVTVNSFLADGGDNFDTFATVAGPRLEGGLDLEALVNYLGVFSPVAPPSADRVLVIGPAEVISSGGALGTVLTPGPIDIDGDGTADVDFVSFGVDSGFLDASASYGLVGNIGGIPGTGAAWVRDSSGLVAEDGVGRNEIISAVRGAMLNSDDNWSKVHLSSGDGWVQWAFGSTRDVVTPVVFVREGANQDLSASQAAALASPP